MAIRQKLVPEGFSVDRVVLDLHHDDAWTTIIHAKANGTVLEAPVIGVDEELDNGPDRSPGVVIVDFMGIKGLIPRDAMDRPDIKVNNLSKFIGTEIAFKVIAFDRNANRSEERRGGEQCRSGWWPYH